MNVTDVVLPADLRGTMTVSIDLEDWHQLVIRRFRRALPECSRHVDAQTHRLLDHLDAACIRATFFVLGMVARARPELVRLVQKRGHEVASHGASHVPLFLLSAEEVRRDLEDSKKLLEDIIGAPVVGFRAPEFSIRTANLATLEAVARAGYRYDSSIFPIHHRRYGVAGFSRNPCRVRHGDGATIWELPLATAPVGRVALPIAGGGYFRLFPSMALRALLRRNVAHGAHSMLYFHPYEFRTEGLELDASGLPDDSVGRARARVWLALQRIGRTRVAGRFDEAVRGARFVRACDIVEQLDQTGPRSASRELPS